MVPFRCKERIIRILSLSALAQIAVGIATSALAMLALTANASTLQDKFDPDLAEHPYIGKLYAKSFKSGVRIPAAFRGEWSTDRATRGTDGDDLDTRIFIRAVTVGFGDETHVVTKAKIFNSRSVLLTYGPLIENYHFLIPPPVLSLSSDGRILEGRDASGGKSRGRWMKCPRTSNR
jgi:hypothetical protein